MSLQKLCDLPEWKKLVEQADKMDLPENHLKYLVKEKNRLEKNFVKITCPSCKGKKRLYDYVNKREKTCYVCSGMGQRRIPRLMEGQSICTYCSGMGKLIRRGVGHQPVGYDKCRICRGKGINTF